MPGIKWKIPVIRGYSSTEIVAFMKIVLGTNKFWARRACVVIYQAQTAKEKKNMLSEGHDGIGFSKIDSLRLSYISSMINSQKPLTKSDEKYLLRVMPKYTKQLMCSNYVDMRKMKVALDRYFGVTETPFK